MRFGRVTLLSRQQGVRPALRAMQAGRPFYYLPDMDYGQRDTIFVPFFGIATATITGVSRLARLAGARVLPCVTRMLPGGEGYVVRFLPAWENYPGASIEADTRRMNDFVEEQVRQMPEQYLWVHKRFKTRPPGESAVVLRRIMWGSKHGCVHCVELRAARANRGFGTDEKRIRTETTVLDKNKDSSGGLFKIVDRVRMCFSSARNRRSARTGRRPRNSGDE